MPHSGKTPAGRTYRSTPNHPAPARRTTTGRPATTGKPAVTGRRRPTLPAQANPKAVAAVSKEHEETMPKMPPTALPMMGKAKAASKRKTR